MAFTDDNQRLKFIGNGIYQTGDVTFDANKLLAVRTRPGPRRSSLFGWTVDEIVLDIDGATEPIVVGGIPQNNGVPMEVDFPIDRVLLGVQESGLQLLNDLQVVFHFCKKETEKE